MVTGIASANTEFSVKFLELLLGAAPKLRRIGFLLDRNSAGFPLHMENVRRSSAQNNIEGRIVEISRLEDVEPALARLANEGIQGLVVVSSAGPLSIARPRILKFAASRRWPVIGGVIWPDDGALLGYGSDPSANYRRAAHLADRILKGTKPSEMPIERPMTFEMVVNLKTANTLGITMPPEIMVQATRVIE